MHEHKQLAPISGTPKSFFKALFTGTCLDDVLRRMSTTKEVPDGPKSQECKKNRGQSKLPAPYIPEMDVIQEALAVIISPTP